MPILASIVKPTTPPNGLFYFNFSLNLFTVETQNFCMAHSVVAFARQGLGMLLSFACQLVAVSRLLETLNFE
jgi:hypothetical protein